MKTDMIHNLAVSWTNKLNRYAQKKDTDLLKMTLGIEILLHNIPKLILMVLSAVLAGVLLHTLLTWLSFACVRRYACGIHAGNSINCTFITLLLFVAGPYILKDVYIGTGAFVIIFAFVVLGLYKYAPADTAARPIFGKKRRASLKKKAVISGIVAAVLTLVFLQESFYVFVAAGAVYATVLILPLTYVLLKRSMNNYEKYDGHN
jgi:accessory gene regulator B